MTTSLTQAESLLRHITPAEQDSYYIEKAKIFVKKGKRQAAQDLFVCVLKSNNNLANSAIVSNRSLLCKSCCKQYLRYAYLFLSLWSKI